MAVAESRGPNADWGEESWDDLWRDFDDPWKGAREFDGRKSPTHIGRVSKIPEDHHFESFVARESIRFLKNHGKNQPFFLISSLLKPHDPFMPAHRFADLHLIDAGEHVFYRILDGDDLAIRLVDKMQTRIKRRGFAGAGWPGDEK